MVIILMKDRRAWNCWREGEWILDLLGVWLHGTCWFTFGR